MIFASIDRFWFIVKERYKSCYVIAAISTVSNEVKFCPQPELLVPRECDVTANELYWFLGSVEVGKYKSKPQRLVAHSKPFVVRQRYRDKGKVYIIRDVCLSFLLAFTW